VTPSSRRSWLARQALGWGLALRARGPLVGFPADPWGYPVRSGNAAHVVGTMALKVRRHFGTRFAIAWLDARVMPAKE
jgi:hypothetical protein